MLARFAAKLVFGMAGVGIDGRRDHDMRLVRTGFVWKALLGGGSVALGEAYMRGDWECRRLDLFFEKVCRSPVAWVPSVREFWLRLLRALGFNLQSKPRALRVGERHYDLGNGFYQAMLGPTMVYTCGIWDKARSLDEAQAAKMELVARKIPNLKEGDEVLDIGFGWGGLMAHLARNHGAKCVGVTVSREQHEYANAAYAGSNLPLEFRFEDYRDFNRLVDHAVSICMIEQVGIANLREYFNKVAGVIRQDGVFVLQVILNAKKSSGFDPWLEKYIFPGGELPTLGQVREASEGVMHILDEHLFGGDYVKTLMAWKENFDARREHFARERGEQFCRMIEYYLCSCAGAFRAGVVTVGQIVFSKSALAYAPVRP